jgi:hypothetical protein
MHRGAKPEDLISMVEEDDSLLVMEGVPQDLDHIMLPNID